MLQGKTAIVTGSTSDIGLGIAEALARSGANVVLNGFGDAARIEATRADRAPRTNARVAPIEKSPEERRNAIVAIDLSPAFHATTAVLPHATPALPAHQRPGHVRAALPMDGGWTAP